MEEKKLKIIFIALSLILLALMLRISKDAGISGDEEVHYKQSEMVFDYFASWGADKSSVDTPKTHLQYYGQAYDNFTTILIHLFGIDDVYTFRHISSTVAAWLTIIISALFAAWLTGYSSAIIVLFLFAVSPTFMGHAQNNLKDIPFALAYISSIFFALKLVFRDTKIDIKTVALLVFSLGLAFGIRAGGFLSFFYVWLLLILNHIHEYISKKQFCFKKTRSEILLFALISIPAFIVGIILWPFALENPIKNSLISYKVMTQFPTTVRQIFEGVYEWSDFLPWYYIPKYMLITIPLLIFSGIISLIFFFKKYSVNQKFKILFLIFTIIFPILFIIVKKPNLYGAWRHFLFIYPGIVILSALGLNWLIYRLKGNIYKFIAIFCIAFLSYHPLSFMLVNHPYYYLYYNQLIGGLNGAYGKYETDYYYHSMREGAEWLNDYLKNLPDSFKNESADNKIIIGGNFPAQWHFRNDNNIIFRYFAYNERSKHEWDYAIIANSYIPPYQLENKIWPPQNTIHTILVDEIPVCAVIKRVSTADKDAIDEFNKGNYAKADSIFEQALIKDPENELIYLKFAELLVKLDANEKAIKVLDRCVEINPDFELALILLGDLALKENNKEIAEVYYKKAIDSNRKYFAAYPKLAKIYIETNINDARKVLYDCLKINPGYLPALKLLADTYRKTDPIKASKYDKLIDNYK